ncbi:AP-3 complex subunit beta-1-like isoform X1 [Pimephales promelas]|uniref:AP-3 complex subunit beta-1-like isoform X1 n=1 Tax=Pimephales promelas TaxID=90988 RepID=UPI001955D493|nr:AP-3 complex subunit beta-1-like isoform X1 [Pimephales promelas]KAG1946447.1 AP-3 complex subunit beta-1 [Pimephales promelas]
MLGMSANSVSYNDQGSVESGVDAAQENSNISSGSGGAAFSLFSADCKKNDDLKEMLENNKESLKLEAMKRIVGLIAKGKNASELFPAVVKNVASKNIELKKLVYVYLVRYAEEQQDLALLSISTFQRALKDPNQLIRASALRVLSSIRVPIIVPIMMLAIKESSTDLSPYVRKTAAHAIQKLYSLDPDQKDHLIEVIEKLLKDKSTLVAGSVVMAFEEVCPDRIDLIHKNYRKLCNMLVDVEEWGQVVIIHMLTRYARTQFVSPWREDAVFDENSEKTFYDSEEERRVEEPKTYVMDPDHRLLLRNTKPLLQSRNTAVVMAVSQLYWHLAPKHEISIVTKSLVRLLRSHREVQYVVLQNIATMSIQRKGMFEPFMKSFYVRSTDATHIKTLKLEILTSMANEANISTILREFQTYVKSQDKAFAAATIQAIGRCATDISEVTDTCLNGLVLLLSNRDETVVAESVVVIKKLLQTQPSQHSDIIKHMAKLFDNITVPMARASILWLMGEYCEHVPKIAPDVLRKMAKTFTSEEDIVKLQIVNLSAKLYLTNSKQTKLLTQYILNLGKYDQNYDIRDRTRFIRQLIVPNEKSGALSKYARRILMAPKPAPVLQSAFKDRDRFQLGTLSHSLNSHATGYLELSNWPSVAPDQSVRNVEVVEPVKEALAPALGKSKHRKSDEKFYSGSEEEEEEEGSSSEDSSSSSGESESESKSEENSDDSNKSSSSQSEKSSSESDTDKKKTQKNKKLQQQKPASKDRKLKNGKAANDKSRSGSESDSESSSSESSSESGSESELDSNSDSGTDQKRKTQSKTVQSKPVTKQAEKKEVSLLDLDDFSPMPVATPKSSIMSPSLLSDLQGLSISPSASALQASSPVFVPETSHELLHRMTGKGLSAQYRFTRQPCIYGNSMVSLQLTLSNNSEQALENIHISEKSSSGQNIHRFSAIERLEPQASVTVSMGVDFNDSTQAANFQLCTKEDEFSVSIQPAVGELLLPITMSEADFTKEQGKLVGMNESSATITTTPENISSQSVNRNVVSAANLGVIPSNQENIHRFAGKTVSSGSLVLVSVALKDPDALITVNTEKTVIASMLLRQFKTALTNITP